MDLLIAGLLTLALLAIASYVRFLLNTKLNKALLCGSVLAVICTNAFIINERWFSLALFVFVIVCSFSFRMIGALVASTISCGLVFFADTSLHWQHYAILTVGYLLVGLISSNYSRFLETETLRSHNWQQQLLRQAKELSIIRSIGTALQSTLELDKILHIILTAITAGHGLGFNRAMLFLLSDDRSHLIGKAAIGSLHTEEVIQIWNITTREKMSLEDYIKQESGANSTNRELIDHIQKTVIPLSGGNILEQVIHDKRIVCVDTRQMKPELESWFGENIEMDELGIVPLLNQGEPMGIILVDNHANRSPIQLDDLERLLPLANQAAMAIHNANLYRQTEEMAITDGLTGLYNQRFFEAMLNSVYNSTRKNQQPLSMLVLDLDFFKSYNDRHGHLAGNELLFQLARLLKQSVRKEDLTFRFGGEEFVVLLSSTKKDDALKVAEKIRRNVEMTLFPHEDGHPSQKLTISIGVASFPEDKQHPRDLFQAADMALYEAKKRGRNQVIAYEEGSAWASL